jgi:hypothetical protein
MLSRDFAGELAKAYRICPQKIYIYLYNLTIKQILQTLVYRTMWTTVLLHVVICNVRELNSSSPSPA